MIYLFIVLLLIFLVLLWVALKVKSWNDSNNDKKGNNEKEPYKGLGPEIAEKAEEEGTVFIDRPFYDAQKSAYNAGDSRTTYPEYESKEPDLIDEEDIKIFGGGKKIKPLSEEEIVDELKKLEYEDVEACAKGGMAALYTARDPNINFKKVCIKVAYSETNPIQICVDKIKKEYKILRDLSDIPEVPECFYDINNGSIVGIVMEYIDGMPLERYAIENEDRNFIKIFMDLLIVLDKIHKKGYVHRDINPSNILIQKGIPRIIDFGTAAAVDGSTDSYIKSGTGTIVMTGYYSAPEQITSPPRISPQNDIYSAGGVMFYCFTKEDPKTFLWSIKKSKMISSGIPHDIAEIIHKSTNYSYESRYASCKDMVDDLKKLLNRPSLVLNFLDKKISIDSYLEINNQIVDIKSEEEKVFSKIYFDLSYQKYYITTDGLDGGVFVFLKNKFLMRKRYYLESGDIFALFYSPELKRYFPIIECEVNANENSG